MEPTIAKHIEIRSDRCGGKPCIAGTRLRVWDIFVWHALRGLSAEEIVHDYPHLSLADVHAALAYFWDHETAIREQMKGAEEVVQKFQDSCPPSLIRPLRGEDADECEAR